MNAQTHSCLFSSNTDTEEDFESNSTGRYCSYCELVQNVNSIILVLTPEGKVLFANQFACQFFGYELDELVGSSVFDTIIPQQDQAGEDLASQLSQKLRDPEQMESNINENVLRDGTRVWIAWRNRAIRDENGNLLEILAVGNDITARREAEEAIRRSEGTLRQTINSSIYPVLVTKLHTGKIIETNNQFRSIFGYSSEEAIELCLTDLICETSDVTHHKICQAIERTISEKDIPSEERKLHSVFECLCKRKDGKTYWAEVTLSYLDQDPEPRNLCVFYDISDRKQSEERLLLQRNRLADLLQAQERERKLIAYEIHDGAAQKLVAATMQLDVSLEMLDKDRSTAKQTLIEGRKMLAQALSEIRRLIAGLRPPQLDESGVIMAIQTLIQESPEPPQIHFDHDVHFKRLAPLAENSLFRIVQESLTNAARYSQSDTIKISLHQTSGSIRLEIQDKGIGFQPDNIRGDRFGLNGIRERASVLGGHAAIRSSPGCGTRITIELPVSLIAE